MKLPRNISGTELVKRLGRLGYDITRQTGSHIRLTCESPGQHHITVPNHDALRIGTLSGILFALSEHHQLTREQIVKKLFDDKR